MSQRTAFNDLIADRLLVILYTAGEESNLPGHTRVVRGTTKLAKLDFFVRHPRHFRAAVRLLAPGMEDTWTDCLDHPMERYRYGPFEKAYYNAFAKARSRGFVTIKSTPFWSANRDFHLTEKGQTYVENELLNAENFGEIVVVAELVGSLFGDWSGSDLADWVKDTFLDVRNTPWREVISDTPRLRQVEVEP